MAEKEKKKKGGIFQAVKEFVYGVAAHDSARFALKSRASMEHLFILITMGTCWACHPAAVLLAQALALCGSSDFHLETPHAPRKGLDGRPGLI